MEVDPEADPPIVRSIPIPVEQHGGPAIAPPAATHPIAVGQGGCLDRPVPLALPRGSRTIGGADPHQPRDSDLVLVRRRRRRGQDLGGLRRRPDRGEPGDRRAAPRDLVRRDLDGVRGRRRRAVRVGRRGGRPADALRSTYRPRGRRELVSTRSTRSPSDTARSGRSMSSAETLSEYDPASIRRRAQVAVNGGDGVVVGDSASGCSHGPRERSLEIDPSTKEPTGVGAGRADAGLASRSVTARSGSATRTA